MRPVGIVGGGECAVRNLLVTTLDWTTIVVSTISGGGLLAVWLQTQVKQRQWEVEREQLRLEANHRDEVDRLAAKTDLRRIVDEGAGSLIAGLREQSVRDNERMDRIEQRNSGLVVELAEAHKQLRVSEAALVDAERKLMVSDEQLSRSQATVERQKEIVMALEVTVTELRVQVEALTQALADCVREGSGD